MNLSPGGLFGANTNKTGSSSASVTSCQLSSSPEDDGGALLPCSEDLALALPLLLPLLLVCEEVGVGVGEGLVPGVLEVGKHEGCGRFA